LLLDTGSAIPGGGLAVNVRYEKGCVAPAVGAAPRALFTFCEWKRLRSLPAATVR
jgi:hypothetical protein